MVEVIEKPKVKGPNHDDFDDMLEHICDPDDVDTSLCGKDISDEPWNHGGPPCQACLYILSHGPAILN